MTIDYPWYMALLCLAVGAAYAAIMYGVGGKGYGRGLRWALAAVRCMVVTALALLLLAPVSRRQIHEKQMPRVVLLADRSGSVAASADSAYNISAIAQLIAQHCNADTIGFGTATSTDIGQALRSAMAPDVSAIVIATDGISTRGASPVAVAQQLPVPVYAVALGDTTTQRDATIANLQAARIASVSSNIAVELTVAAHKLGGSTTRLAVTDDRGQTLHSQNVEFMGTDYAQTFAFSIAAEQPGMHRYTAHLAVINGESNTANNTATFYVDVIDSRRRIAIIASAPHPDLGALKRAIESNPNYEAQVIYADDADAHRWSADTGNYSMAVLHNLPSATHTSIAYADALPKLYIIGLQTDIARFNALHTGFEITSRTNKTSEVSAVARHEFALFGLDEATIDALEAMPPLTATFGEARLSPAVQTMFGSRTAGIDTKQPLLAATTGAAGTAQRAAFVWGEGLWRWRLADWQNTESFAHFDQLISQLVSFTSVQQQRNRLQIEANRRYDADDATPLIRATLYDPNNQPTNRPEVKMHLWTDSMQADYLFSRQAGHYTLALPNLGAGIYRYRATTVDNLSAEGSFAIEQSAAEQRRTTADHATLATLCAATGGALYYPGQEAALSAQLTNIKPVIYTHTRYAQLLHMPLVLVLLLLLLATEWVLRKYNGQL